VAEILIFYHIFFNSGMKQSNLGNWKCLFVLFFIIIAYSVTFVFNW